MEFTTSTKKYDTEAVKNMVKELKEVSIEDWKQIIDVGFAVKGLSPSRSIKDDALNYILEMIKGLNEMSIDDFEDEDLNYLLELIKV